MHPRHRPHRPPPHRRAQCRSPRILRSPPPLPPVLPLPPLPPLVVTVVPPLPLAVELEPPVTVPDVLFPPAPVVATVEPPVVVDPPVTVEPPVVVVVAVPKSSSGLNAGISLGSGELRRRRSAEERMRWRERRPTGNDCHG